MRVFAQKIGGVCCACVFVWLCALPVWASQTVGSVISVQPSVTVERAGQRVPLALKDPLYLSDTLHTDAVGKVQVLFSDDSTVALAPNTVFAVQEYADTGKDARFRGTLSTGLARFITGKIVESNPSAYTVSTPEATIGIRGTDYAVETRDGRTHTSVLNVRRHGVTVNGIHVPHNHRLTVPGTGTPLPMTPEERNSIRDNTSISRGGGATPATPFAGRGGGRGPGRDPLSNPAGQPDTSLNQQPNAGMGGNLGTATVSGTLRPGDSAFAGHNGTFSFNVNLGTGAVSNASMANSAGENTHYSLSGGSGSVAGGALSVGGFSGAWSLELSGPGVISGTISPNYPTYMQGTSSGGTVSGIYNVETGPSGYGVIDNGTFSNSGTPPPPPGNN